MEKYKSFYPTLRQAKTKWSSPAIVQKQGEGPSHDWFALLKHDKLAKSALLSKLGSITKQQRIYHEEAEPEQHIYHVTHTKHVAKIQKQGIMPMKTSNWVKAGDKERYGGGEVYAFTHKADAEKWAGRMDWAHHQKLGSGKISIITAKRPSDRKFEVDHNDPLSQAGKSGDWLKTHGSIEPHHIVSVEPYKPRKLAESKVAEKIKAHPAVEYYGGKDDDHFINLKKGWHMGDGQRSFGSENAAAALKTLKQVRQFKPGEAKEYGLDEAKDRIGKSTPSAEEIAKKHNKEVAEIQAQIDKGIKVEREHTNSDAEAHEIARDHLDEFPDYYDRLDAMEKKAKKDMKEGYDPEKEQMRNRIAAHKEVAQKMAQKYGEQSQEAAFHRALVKRYEKELDEDKLEEAVKKPKKKKQSKKAWQAQAVLAKKSGDAEKIRAALRAHAQRNEEKELDKPVKFDKPKPTVKMMKGELGKTREVSRLQAELLKKQGWKVVKEEVANSVGGGMSPVIGGEGNIHGFDPIMGKPIRRKKFAGKQVFVVDPTTYHKAYLGKRRNEHYEKYLEGCPMADEIRAYGRKYWDESIIIENEQTGAMVYLKYGRK